jgi:alpha/beta hydrolase fold
MSTIAGTVSTRAQSRWSSQASETQLTGCPPAWVTRSRPARCASGEVPAAALLMSPYVDLTLSGTTMDSRGAADPLLGRALLAARVPDDTTGQDAALPLISPLFAELSGLPHLIIQGGTDEVLLDDALRLAARAALADVAVTLDITPRVPHVFQTFYRVLDEATPALDRAGRLLSADLAGLRRSGCVPVAPAVGGREVPRQLGAGGVVEDDVSRG